MELRREREMSEEYDDDPIGEHEPELMPDVEAHSELRPCPFCGGKGGNIYDTEKHDPSCYFIKTASMKVMYGTVEEWNKRPIEDALRKQLELAKRKLLDIDWSGLQDNDDYKDMCRRLSGVAHNALAEIEQIETGSQDKPDNGA